MKNKLSQNKLILFFTRGVSLKTWGDMGVLSREVSLYHSLRPYMRNIIFVTYGDASDKHYANQLKGIRIVCNRLGLSEKWYVYLLTRIYLMMWQGQTIVKSNQMRGADIALHASRRFAKKFIARCGYLHSDFIERRHGVDSKEAVEARKLEQEVFAGADRVVVTTSAMQQEVLKRYHLPKERIKIIPNYVRTDLFHSKRKSNLSNRKICFVGRLDEQKNIFALLKAIKGLDVELMIVGRGPLEKKLHEEVKLNKLPVCFLGNVPHQQLYEVLNSAQLFVLPSYYEGHPKALLEAMSSGMPVIATDVSGVRELINHRETGFLCGTSSEEIREAIKIVLSDIGLCVRMGRNARNYIHQNFALEKIVRMELALLEDLTE